MAQVEGGFELKDDKDGMMVIKNTDFSRVLFIVRGNDKYEMDWNEAERLANFILNKGNVRFGY